MRSPSLKLITKPAAEVVSLEELKNFLRVDETADDALITRLIKAAREKLEDYSGIKFLTQTWLVAMDCFPSRENNASWLDREGVIDAAVTELRNPGRKIELPIGPVQSVSSIKIYADDDTEETVPASIYSVGKYSERGVIALRLGQVWPPTILRPTDAVLIEVVVGLFTAAADCPEDIRQAHFEAVAYWYENRGDAEKQKVLPASAMGLVEGYRRYKC